VILADTSAWINFLRGQGEKLQSALDAATVLTHPFVSGELACGNLPRRGEMLGMLNRLPSATIATHAEVLDFVESHKLMGRGIGYVDAHLLAAVALTPNAKLLTLDVRLAQIARELRLSS
jgi:predicted nucleic acid-binding protein